MSSDHIFKEIDGHLFFSNDHHKPSAKSSAFCPMNSAHILEKFCGHLYLFLPIGQRFSWSPQTVYKVICFMSNEFCSHSWKIRWSSVSFNDHHKLSAKSSALCPMNSAQILEKFGGCCFSPYRPKVFMITTNRLQSHLLYVQWILLTF